eukprot:9256706-Pyramimonas_sp.AAC.1
MGMMGGKYLAGVGVEEVGRGVVQPAVTVHELEAEPFTRGEKRICLAVSQSHGEKREYALR